ncbi:thiamine ABC transporter substrate-binding protein [Streptomyces sulphureus]|uniref:thiamine ABC transporter substrate-binding protein n=1 Tax=Streptomyces sulphureus TaxID=47758 RepID=UPI0003684772|nr:thiamine ABC transporter substrate-binding protein [Streptomyces sulphureus]
MHRYVRRAAAASTALALALLAACGAGSGDDGKTVRLVTHDSFNVSKSVLKKFTERTGYKVEVVSGGDAGAMVNQAALNKGNPQGDVLFGVDTALLSRALDQKIFTPYRAKGLDKVPERYRADDRNRVTPVDSGEICVNYDRKYFAEKDLEPPRTLDDLTKPAYRDLLVTENAATSSPGLGFLLATVDEYGEDGWNSYWKKLRANGVEVVDGWEQAYNDRFSGSRGGKGEGDRPLVVSYASSPPVEVVDADPKPKQAPTGVARETCFQQVEFAGLLDGAGNAEGGRKLLDFLLGKEFQEDMPLQMFVNPVREDARLPELFTRYGEQAKDPATMAPERIADNHEQWVKAWTSLVVK